MGLDKYEKLKELKKLLDDNLITQEEFSKLKNEMLFEKRNSVETLKELYKINYEEKIDSTNGLFSGIEYKNLNDEQLEKNNSKHKKKGSLFINIEVVIAVILGFFIWVEYTNKSNVNDKSTKNSNFYPETSTINNSQENILTTCKICGRSFSGDGYDKIDGVWQRNTNMQTELCSSNCAMIEGQRQDQKYNDILVKHGYAPIDFDAQSSTSNHAQPNSNGFFTGSDGQLHQVSPCGYCHHTGFIDSGDGMQVCPMCDGKGEKIY